MIGHEHECTGERSVHFAKVKYLNTSLNTLTFWTNPITADDLIDSYEMNVQSHEWILNKTEHNNARYRKKLEFNYDNHTDSAKEKKIALLSDKVGIGRVFTKIDCEDCYTKGNIYFNWKVKSKGLRHIPEYFFDLKGSAFVNFNVRFNIVITLLLLINSCI